MTHLWFPSLPAWLLVALLFPQNVYYTHRLPNLHLIAMSWPACYVAYSRCFFFNIWSPPPPVIQSTKLTIIIAVLRVAPLLFIPIDSGMQKRWAESLFHLDMQMRDVWRGGRTTALALWWIALTCPLTTSPVPLSKWAGRSLLTLYIQVTYTVPPSIFAVSTRS